MHQLYTHCNVERSGCYNSRAPQEHTLDVARQSRFHMACSGYGRCSQRLNVIIWLHSSSRQNYVLTRMLQYRDDNPANAAGGGLCRHCQHANVVTTVRWCIAAHVLSWNALLDNITPINALTRPLPESGMSDRST